jgi:hypothetical protein
MKRLWVWLLLAAGGIVGYVSAAGVPFVRQENIRYSIGIYSGASPLALAPADVSNPVLTAEDVTDVEARFIADPFMIKDGDLWHMFFEVVTEQRTKKIGTASSVDGLRWTYRQIVLEESFPLSYPLVFEHGGQYFMVPEAAASGTVRLYRAASFPLHWEFVAVLLDRPLVDPTVFRHGDLWWMFAATDTNDTLHLFHASQLTGPWMEHPRSPVITNDANVARPGGRVTMFDGRLFRFAQDDDPDYGNQVHAFEVTRLTEADYEEREVPQNPIVKASGAGWNAKKMHHVDPHRLAPNRWIAVVDGFGWRLAFGL